MEHKFLAQLNELDEQAKDEILALLSDKKELILFEPDPTIVDEWTKDIHEMPGFASYSKYGFVDYAAIRVIKMTEADIAVTGILKGESYPDEVTIKLSEMDSYHVLALADYLLAESI